MDNFNIKDNKSARRYLRNNMSKAEQILWYHLKSRQLKGYKFRRQFGIGKYIVDFYCPEAKLVIEIDGDSHYEEGAHEYDSKREYYIRKSGIKIIRFTNNNIYHNLDETLTLIKEKLPDKT